MEFIHKGGIPSAKFFYQWFGNQKLIDRAKKIIGLKEEGDII